MRQIRLTGEGHQWVRAYTDRRFVSSIKLGILASVFVPLLLGSPFCSSSQARTVESVYSELVGKGCKSLKQDTETGAGVEECVGIGGFNLLVLNDDSRSSITVVTPEKKEFPLDYWDVVTHAFSSLGTKAEWRVARRGSKTTPLALIVRVDYMDQSNVAAPKKKSVLAVAKITPERICVTENVKSGADANARARAAADSSATRGCLATLP